jgi:hypothetical protein
VPGDNDWTDCWGRYGAATMPFFDPEERLAHERLLFNQTDQSLGHKTLTLDRESYEGGQYVLYSENVRWKLGPVVYIGLNVQGSNDNYPYPDTDVEGGPTVPVRGALEIQRQRDEQAARRAANFHWLDEGFAYASDVGAKGVMIVGVPGSGRPGPRRQPLLQDRQADQPIDRWGRAGQLHAGGDVRRAQHALGPRAHRP